MDDAPQAGSGGRPADRWMDAATAAPLHPAARQALVAALDDGWADPARPQGAGRRAALLLDAAREAVADVLGCRPPEVSFAPGALLATQLGVLGTAVARRRSGRHVVRSAVEHSAVLAACDAAAAGGGEVSAVPVDAVGRVDPSAFEDALRSDTAVACLQAANGEVGTRQPVEEVAGRCAGAGVPLVVDAGAVLGHEAVPPGWSVLVAGARTWGGPAGVGVIAVRDGVRWRSPLPHDELRRESGRVPAEPFVPAVVAAAAALRAAADEAAEVAPRLRRLVDRLRTELPRRVDDVVVLGDDDRVPHVVTASFLYVDGERLLAELERHGISASSGSACASGADVPSHVLAAMGALTHGNLRVSLHRGSTDDDVEHLLDVLPPVVARLRADAGAGAL